MQADTITAGLDPTVLRLEEVSKAYGTKLAVDQVSFGMTTGSTLGLLGPNGAGKTSLIRMITTITRPDSGQIFFNGAPLNRLHPSQIGYLPEERGLYRKMNVGEHLLYLGQLKNMSREQAETTAREWLEKFDLGSYWKRKVEELSKGMQQQVQFIATVLHGPRLLILDEPFSGLDPLNAERLKQEILRLHREGTSIIFSTHRMEQVEELCEHIVLIHRGRKVLDGLLPEVRRQFRQNRYHVSFGGELPEGLLAPYSIISADVHSATLQLHADQHPNELLRRLLDARVEIHGFREMLPSLNDIFIRQVSEGRVDKWTGGQEDKRMGGQGTGGPAGPDF